MDDETLVKVEHELRQLRINLKQLRRLGHDTALDEAMLVELELLLAAIRTRKRGKKPNTR